MHHGIQHLGGCNTYFALLLRHADHLLLQSRNLLQRNLHTEVAAGYHDAVGLVQNLLQVIHALYALDLRNDLDLALVLCQDFADLADVIRRPGKGCRNVIKAQNASEFDVAPILFADKRHGQIRTGHIDALVVGYRAAVDDRAEDLGPLDLVYPQLNQAVIDQNAAADLHILRKILVGY